jgi:hypothetical protein
MIDIINTSRVDDYELNNLYNRLRSNSHIDLVDDAELELITLKEKVKSIEKSIKESNRPKTITISGKSHNKIKNFCNTLNLSIGDWCEKTLLKEIKDNFCVIDDEDYDEVDDITKKWLDEHSRNRNLIKYNKHLIGDEFKFVGYSLVDGDLIYEYIGDDFLYTTLINNFDELGIKISKASEIEVSNIKNNDHDDFLVLKNRTL